MVKKDEKTKQNKNKQTRELTQMTMMYVIYKWIQNGYGVFEGVTPLTLIFFKVCTTPQTSSNAPDMRKKCVMCFNNQLVTFKHHMS